MKKIIPFLTVLLLIPIINANAIEKEQECSINLNITGEGIVIDQSTNMTYKNNKNLKIPCGKKFSFLVKGKEGFKTDFVKQNGMIISGNEYNGGLIYSVDKIDKDTTFDINFISAYSVEKISDGNTEFDYYSEINRISVETLDNDVEMMLNNLSSYISEETTLYLNINGIKLLFPQKFLNKYRNNTIRISAREVNASVLSTDQANSVKNGVFYDFNFFVQGEKQKELGSNVQIKIPYDLSINNVVHVFYVDNDGNTQEIDSDYNDGLVEFKTKHFSIFAVSSEKVNFQVVNDANDKLQEIEEQILAVDYNKIFTVAIIIGFVLYLIKDFRKKDKSK